LVVAGRFSAAKRLQITAQGFSPGYGLSHLLVHSVFSTKDRRPFLRPEDIRNEIYAYMAGMLKNLECYPIKIGGMEDHIHILSALSKNIAFSELIGRLKGSSSKRLKEKGIHGFSWQNGYGAFSVSESDVEAVVAYISNQAAPYPISANFSATLNA
jgi:REP-associated tyrosine transposase